MIKKINMQLIFHIDKMQEKFIKFKSDTNILIAFKKILFKRSLLGNVCMMSITQSTLSFKISLYGLYWKKDQLSWGTGVERLLMSLFKSWMFCL